MIDSHGSPNRRAYVPVSYTHLDVYKRQAYNLFPRKGALLPGADADIVIFDDSVTDTINDNTSLYNGIEIQDVYKRQSP